MQTKASDVVFSDMVCAEGNTPMDDYQIFAFGTSIGEAQTLLRKSTAELNSNLASLRELRNSYIKKIALSKGFWRHPYEVSLESNFVLIERITFFLQRKKVVPKNYFKQLQRNILSTYDKNGKPFAINSKSSAVKNGGIKFSDICCPFNRFYREDPKPKHKCQQFLEGTPEEYMLHCLSSQFDSLYEQLIKMQSDYLSGKWLKDLAKPEREGDKLDGHFKACYEKMQQLRFHLLRREVITDEYAMELHSKLS